MEFKVKSWTVFSAATSVAAQKSMQNSSFIFPPILFYPVPCLQANGSNNETGVLPESGPHGSPSRAPEKGPGRGGNMRSGDPGWWKLKRALRLESACYRLSK